MNMRVSPEAKKRLVEKHNGTCPVCGRTQVPLEVCHVTPIHKEGAETTQDIGVMCPTCHADFDRQAPTEMEFNSFLADLLKRTPRYANVSIEPRISANGVSKRADITARENSSNILIECKRPAFFTERLTNDVISQIEAYKKISNYDKYILAFPGRLTTQQQAQIESHDIEIWDIDFIASKFSGAIVNSPHQYFRSLFQSIAPKNNSRDTDFKNLLEAIPHGRANWSEYQKLVGQIFAHLFSPPLDGAISESADELSINRRDWIFPNYADTGFWRFLRDAYGADYIIIDAKNYKDPISKSQVLQIANYLKPRGAGSFAIIASRAGMGTSAQATVREQWILHGKLILVMNDQDLKAMLLSSSAGGDPSRVIGQLIQDFRLSI